MQLTFNEAVNYGCSFVAKLSWKKNFFFGKIFVFLQNIHYLQKKIFLYGKKSFIIKNLFLLEKFYREKLYLISEIYFYTENICVTNKI